MELLLLIGVPILLFLAVWLWLICPRLSHRDQMAPFDGQIIAHRGMFHADAGIPENTMAAFRCAVEHGYGIETDVRLSKDGVVVISHDASLRRVFGVDMPVADLTADELNAIHAPGTEEGVPRFEDFLRLVDGKVPLVIELKGSKKDLNLVPAVVELLRNYRGPFCVESFDPNLLRAFAKAMPEAPRGFLSQRFLLEKDRRSFLFWCAQCLLFNFAFRPDFIAYGVSGTGRLPLTLVCGMLGCRAACWTIRTKEQLAHVLPHYDLLICENLPTLFPGGETTFPVKKS